MSFSQRLPVWLKVPVFEDEDTARSARLLNAISLIILGVSIVFSLFVSFFYPQPEPALSIIAVSWPIVFGVLILVRRRRISIASFFFVITFWLYFTGMEYFLGGVSSMLLILQVITVILAALLLGGRVALVVTVFTVLAGGMMAYLEVRGLLPTPFLIMTPLTSWLAYTAIYAVIGALLFYAMRGFQDALERARRNEQSLAKQNLILGEQRSVVQASEARWRSLVDNAPALILNATPDGIITFVNDQGSQSILGQSVEAFVDVPYVERVRQAMEQVITRQTEVQYEVSYTLPDQPTDWYTVNVGPIWNQDTMVGLTFIAFDITAQKRAEQERRDSEELMRSINQSAPDNIIKVDLDGTILFINHTVPDLTVEEVVGTPIFKYVPESFQSDMRACFDRVIETGQADQYGVEYHTKDGQVRFFASRVGPVMRDGEVIALTIISSDVTERRQAMQALQASEERNRALLDGIPDMMFRLRTDGTFLDYKAESAQELALPPEAIIGSTLAQSPLPAAVVDDIKQCIGHAMTTGEVQTFEYELVVPIGVQAYEARIVRSGAYEVVCLVRNVTKRKRAEAEQAWLIEELEARNAELERFTYTVSHDLKTPLVTIKGFLGLLMQDAVKGDTQRMEGDIEQIASATDKMARLLNELLQLSRIGRLMTPPEAVSLSDLASEAAGLVAGQVVARGVSVEIEPSMPVVYGDRLRLLEVYQNLIDNAVKFMGDQQRPCIEIGAQQRDREVVCYVRDNGIGIDPKYHENVFGLFNRLDPDAEGTGIGLALVRRIVEVHGGKIWVESEGEGQGATFYFNLSSKSMPEEDDF